MLCSAVQCICTVTLLFLSCANENFWIKSEPLNPRAYIWCIEPCHQQKPFNVRLLLKRRSPKRTLVSIFCELKDIMHHKIAWFLNNGYLHHGCFFCSEADSNEEKAEDILPNTTSVCKAAPQRQTEVAIFRSLGFLYQ